MKSIGHLMELTINILIILISVLLEHLNVGQSKNQITFKVCLTMSNENLV